MRVPATSVPMFPYRGHQVSARVEASHLEAGVPAGGAYPVPDEWHVTVDGVSCKALARHDDEALDDVVERLKNHIDALEDRAPAGRDFVVDGLAWKVAVQGPGRPDARRPDPGPEGGLVFLSIDGCSRKFLPMVRLLDLPTADGLAHLTAGDLRGLLNRARVEAG